MFNPQPKNKAKRLRGKDLEDLRRDVYDRDGGRCVDCGQWVPLNGDVFTRAHLAHIISRGAGGSDIMENTQIKCPFCHLQKEHGPRWSKRTEGK